ncbi:MAG TPA: SAM-dependent methyltransferase [Alphaproteobacteria bacterium]|nr:SAM-dependent methyltransferase [Alphaproteobacteria bacterium]
MDSAIRHYYAARPEPFGAFGDFTTAPEISQMFGEVIGAWAAQMWFQLGQPPRLSLIELGPGRGTLMADMLRATARVEGFHAALHIVLVEASPALRTRQAEALGGRSPQWRENLPLSENNPALVIGNEFLDALPVHQIIYRSGEWRERAVAVEENGVFAFTDLAVPPALLEHIPPGLPSPKEGDILELAPARNEYVRQTLRLIKPNGGAALFLDYGYDRTAYGDSMQALKRHQFTSPLSEPGGADLTAHVDFAALGKVAAEGPLRRGCFCSIWAWRSGPRR